MKNFIIALVVLALIGFGFYYFTKGPAEPSVTETPDLTDGTGETPTSTDEMPRETVLGTSADGREIVAYHFGTGDTELLFVGGIHGGYEWNTALVAYELIDYLEEEPDAVPENVRVTVVPVLNPDGLYAVVGTTERFSPSDVTGDTVPGRFNGNNVDLNRNFDCDWQTTGTWQNTSVSGGSAAFSEPESKAIRDYVNMHEPAAAVVWYSAVGGVFASNCHNGVLSETTEILNVYADASGYPAYEEFNYYEITGDMVNWLAKENIPAISVLLTNHTDIEWAKNKAGIDALLSHYAE